MAFKGEMAGVYEVDLGIGHIAAEGFGTGGDKRRVVLPPYGDPL